MTRIFPTIIAACLCAAPTGGARAQDLGERAALGDRLSTTAVGDAYHDALAPARRQAMLACLGAGHALPVGQAMTLVAQVGANGGWTDVAIEPATAAAACIAQHLQAATLAPPAGWDWQRGAFALTLRIGAGRGSVGGVRHGD